MLSKLFRYFTAFLVLVSCLSLIPKPFKAYTTQSAFAPLWVSTASRNFDKEGLIRSGLESIMLSVPLNGTNTLHASKQGTREIRSVLPFVSNTMGYEMNRGSRSKARSINKHIDLFFKQISKNQATNELPCNLKHFISSQRHMLDKVHVLSVLYRCAKMGRADIEEFMDLDVAMAVLTDTDRDRNSNGLIEVDTRLNIGQELTSRLRKSPGTRSIATAMYSLHNLDGDSVFVERLIELINAWIVDELNIEPERASITGQGVGMCLLGFRNLSPQDPRVVTLISNLTLLIRRGNAHLSAHDAASAFYGLQVCSLSLHSFYEF